MSSYTTLEKVRRTLVVTLINLIPLKITGRLGVDAKGVLRGANFKFSGRFRQVEQLVAERNLDWAQLDWAVLEAIWEEVKTVG